MKVTRAKDLTFVPASHEDQAYPGALKKVLFRYGDIVKGDVQMVNWAHVPKGRSFQLHYHEDMDEVFIIVSGNALMTVDGEKLELGSGDAVVVKAHERHEMMNTGDSDIEYIVFGVSTGKGGKTIVM